MLSQADRPGYFPITISGQGCSALLPWLYSSQAPGSRKEPEPFFQQAVPVNAGLYGIVPADRRTVDIVISDNMYFHNFILPYSYLAWLFAPIALEWIVLLEILMTVSPDML